MWQYGDENMEKQNNAASLIKPHEILHQAEQFNNAAQRLRTGVPNEKGSFVLPSCVCVAFSIELYFKYLIFVENKSLDGIKTHKLDDLFKAISPDFQKTILDNIALIMPKEQFLYTLSDLSDSFEIWRFVYEYEKITISTRLHEISDLLSVECKRIDKALQLQDK